MYELVMLCCVECLLSNPAQQQADMGVMVTDLRQVTHELAMLCCVDCLHLKPA